MEIGPGAYVLAILFSLMSMVFNRHLGLFLLGFSALISVMAAGFYVYLTEWQQAVEFFVLGVVCCAVYIAAEERTR